MKLNYINNIIKENNLFLNSNYKKNNNLFLKEFNGTYNQNCLAKPLLFTEDKFIVYSTLNKFNSFLVKRKHIYKRGFYSADLFAKDEDINGRVPSTFVFNYDVAFIGNNDEKNDILVDTQYLNNVNTNYYKRLRKVLVKSFYKGEIKYLWRMFMIKYNLNFSLDTLKTYETTKLYLSKALIERAIIRISSILTRNRLHYSFKHKKFFPIYISHLNKFGVFMFLGNIKLNGFAFFDKILSGYSYIKKIDLVHAYSTYMLHNVFSAKLLKAVPYSVKTLRRGKSRYVLGLDKRSVRFMLNKVVKFKKNKFKLQHLNKFNKFNKFKFNKFMFNNLKKKNFKQNKQNSKYIKPKQKYKFYNKQKKHYLN